MQIIASYNSKGGVGKTTFCVCAGAALADRGASVLVIDLDAQGDASRWLQADRGYHPSIGDVLTQRLELPGPEQSTNAAEQLDIIPSSSRLSEVDFPPSLLREMLEGTEYDYVLCDCPPVFSTKLPHSVAGTEAADTVIVPLTPSFSEVQGLGRTQERVGSLDWFVLLNRINRSENVSEDVRNFLKERLVERLIPVHIRKSARFKEAPQYHEPITEYAPSSRGADDYGHLAAWIMEEL